MKKLIFAACLAATAAALGGCAGPEGPYDSLAQREAVQEQVAPFCAPRHEENFLRKCAALMFFDPADGRPREIHLITGMVDVGNEHDARNGLLHKADGHDFAPTSTGWAGQIIAVVGVDNAEARRLYMEQPWR